MRLGERPVAFNPGVLELTSLVDIWYLSTSLRLLWLVNIQSPGNADSTLFAGSHHKMGQEHPSHKLRRSQVFRAPRGGYHGVYHGVGDGGHTLDHVSLWPDKYRNKKTLHCPKQLERSNDVYEDLATRGEHTLNYYGDYLIFLSSKKCYNGAYRVVRKE
jgi:hypothetical protein